MKYIRVGRYRQLKSSISRPEAKIVLLSVSKRKRLLVKLTDRIEHRTTNTQTESVNERRQGEYTAPFSLEVSIHILDGHALRQSIDGSLSNGTLNTRNRLIARGVR